MRELTHAINKTFDYPAEIVSALASFDQAIPRLRSVRNPLTHPSDDDRLDGVAWFDSVVRLLPNGSVEYLVDPRYEHHDAALELTRALGAAPTCRRIFSSSANPACGRSFAVVAAVADLISLTHAVSIP